MDIQPHVIQKRISNRRANRDFADCQILGKIKARIYGEPDNRDIPGKLRALRGAGIAQIGMSGGANARGITQTNVSATGGKIEIDTVPVRDESAHIQLTATGMSSE